MSLTPNPARHAIRNVIAMAAVAFLSFGTFGVGVATAQSCTTPTSPGGGDSVAEIGSADGRGTYFTADCSGNLYSVSFNVDDKKTATTAEVHLYADQPSGIMVLFAKEEFTPVDGLNTVVILSQPAIQTGRVYSFVVAKANAPMDVEQLLGGQGVDCPAGVPESCTETGANEIPFSLAFPTPELEMSDSAGVFASDDAAPSGTDRDLEGVNVGSSEQSTITISNNGTGILMVTSISFGDVTPGAGAIFTAWPPSTWVPIGGSREIVITFSPTDAGTQVASMIMVNDDPDENPTSFHVTGAGLMDFGDLPVAHDPVTILGAGDAARHVPTGPILGSVRDSEPDGLTSADAGLTVGGDDLGGVDDEDGITFYLQDPDGSSFSRLLAGSTNSVVVELSGAGTAYLQGWVDANGNGSLLDGGEDIISNHLLSSGSNVVTFTLPAGTALAAGLRFRVTGAMSQPGSLVEAGGFQPDGEVEDYVIDIMSSAAIEIDMITGVGRVDSDGTHVTYSDGAGSVIFRALLTALTSLDFVGANENSVLTIGGAMATAGIPITFDGGTGFNTLVIEDSGLTQASVSHVFTTSSAGTITVSTGPTVIGYTNLSPITDNLSSATRSFDFSSALAETITLSDTADGASGNGFSFIDSDVGGESVSFKNPTTSLTITSSGGGAESIIVGDLDSPLAGTFSNLSVSGGSGATLFTVTPTSRYSIAIDGGAPSGVCPGDALAFDFSNGAAVNATTNVAGVGTVSFTGAHTDVLFTEIESNGSADVGLSLNYSLLYATDDLSGSNGTELVLTARNNGPSDANCVTVAMDSAFSDWLASGFGVTASGGTSFLAPTWSIPSIAVGSSETLSVTGFVNPAEDRQVGFTSSATQDSRTANDTATLELSLGFEFPTKAHVNSATYYNRITSQGAYEALLVGLFQGSPGLDGAVWCKIPEVVVGEWPRPALPLAAIGNRWRPCATGLPFPLVVNDLFQDSNGTLWLGAWGASGLYRSDDGGETWTTPGGFSIVYAIVEDSTPGILYMSAGNGLVYRSLSGGTTWHEVASLPGVSADTPWSLVSHPTIAGVVYAGLLGGGVFVSQAYGSSWEVLDDAGTAAVENDALLDTDGSGDDFAGHVFDLEFSPDADYLYAATGKGVWRSDLTSGATDFTGSWTRIGPTVTLSDLSVVTPETRTLAFAMDGAGDSDLIVGSWGFGAFSWDTPNTLATFSELSLRSGNVTFIAVSGSAQIFLGTSNGETLVLDSLTPTATTNQGGPGKELPDGYYLGQNYPNPFNPVTTISFEIPAAGYVRLAVYDPLGREVALLVDGMAQAGPHRVQFAAGALPTGTYLYRMSTEGGSISRLLVLIK